MQEICGVCKSRKWILEELKEPYPALIRAINNDHVECVKLLLRKGANVNARSSETALITAAKCGNQKCVELLIKAGADVNLTDTSGCTALIEAAKFGHETCLELLVKAGAKVNNVANEETALLQAALKGNDTSVHLLIQAGADVNISHKDGDTALLRAVVVGDESSVNLLIKAGADVNRALHHGDSSLYMAVRNHNDKCVKMLLEAGADVNIQRKIDGSTALMRAAETGQEGIVRYLIQSGANVNVRNDNEITALMVAAGSRIFNAQPYSSMRALLEANALVNKKDRLGRNALNYHMDSLAIPHEDITTLLFAAGETTDDSTKANILKIDSDEDSFFELKDLCREAIRKHLLHLNSNLNLIVRIAKLGLPSILASYLLYGANQ